MADDKKPTKAAAKIPESGPVIDAPAVETDAIPVALVQFVRPLAFPGKASETRAKTETLANGQRWAVDFLPSLQHFRIVFFDPGRSIGGKVGFVHASLATSWEPVP